MPEVLKEDQMTHQINEKLLHDARDIQKKISVLHSRITKLEESQDSVSQNVYERVLKDYVEQLTDNKDIFKTLQNHLNEELKILETKKSILLKTLAIHQENLEEIKLRHALGELDDDQFQSQFNHEEEFVKKYSAALIPIDDGIKTLGEVMEINSNIPASFIKVNKGEKNTGSIVEEEKTPNHLQNKKELPLVINGKKESSPEHQSPPVKTSRASIGSELNPQKKSPLEIEETTNPEIKKYSFQKEPYIQIMMHNKKEKTHVLKKDAVIGRSPSSDIILDEAKVSRRHAEIRQVNGHYVITDLGSSNGTIIKGKKIDQHVLNAGDEINIGGSSLVFYFPDQK